MTVKRSIKTQSKKNPKTGTSKKAKEKNAVKVKTQKSKADLKKPLTKSASLNKDTTKAPGKKHLNLNDNNYTIKESTKLKNDNKMKPESLSKRGRASSPRATIPNN